MIAAIELISIVFIGLCKFLSIPFQDAIFFFWFLIGLIDHRAIWNVADNQSTITTMPFHTQFN